MSDSAYLKPSRSQHINPDYTIPLTPPGIPPFATYHHPTDSLPPTPHTSSPPARPYSDMPPPSRLTPYLTLPPRLLLSTLSPALLPLVLTIVHLAQTRKSTAQLAATLKSSLLSACGGLAKGAASLQAIPRYLAMQTNDEVVRATQASILIIGAGLMDCITIIEKVLEFIVDTYRSLLMCTIQLAVQGTLDVLISAVQTISDAITIGLNSLRTGIQNDIASGNNLIQSAVSKLNKATSLVGVDISVPQFTIPSLDGMANVKVPTTFEDALIKLNSSLPSLDTIRDKINALIDLPFEELKDKINASRIEMAASFNSSILPVPSLSSLSAQQGEAMKDDLCSGLDTSLIDDTASALHKLGTTAIGLMCLVLVLCWLALLVWEWRRWRALKQSVEAVEEELSEGRVDPWRVVAVVEHPVLERYGTAVLQRLAQGDRRQTNVRWLASYLSHPTSLALLCVALIGFLSVEFQLLALNSIKSHARENANSTVTASTNTLVAKLNAMAANSSLAYANEFNTAVVAYEARINDELFGTWINHTAIVLNSTLVTFYDEVESVLGTAFGGTILFNPINTFIYCILGSKIANLEAGLTWVSQHAQIALPQLPADVLMLSNASMNELVAPVTAAAVGSGSGGGGGGGSGAGEGEDEGLVGSLIGHFESALKAERTFYAIVLGVWVGILFVGVAVVLWHSGGEDRFLVWRAKRRAARAGMAQTNGGRASGLWPWRSGAEANGREGHPIYDEHTNEKGGGYSKEGDHGSFFHYPSGGANSERPGMTRNGTFGSTMSMLAAPGQAFLRLAGRTPSRATVRPEWHAAGYLAEKASPGSPRPVVYEHPPRSLPDSTRSGGAESPAPIWVDRWYSAINTARSALPSRSPFRGQKLGAALHQDQSERTIRTFEPGRANEPGDGSLLPSAGNGWPANDHGGQPEEARWEYVDPQMIGRALDGDGLDSRNGNGDGRYPALGMGSHQTASSGYPRPLSRAPTLPEGNRIPHRGYAATSPMPTPAVPSKDVQGDEGGDPFVDAREDEGAEELEDAHYAHFDDPYRHIDPFANPTPPLSATSFASANQATAGTANRIQVQHGTAALARVIHEMQQRKAVDPFGQERRI